MSIIGRTFEKAIASGQKKSQEELNQLSEQLKSFESNVVDAINELIILQKKVCDKLEIEMEVNEDEK